jgi:hypothetical protein
MNSSTTTRRTERLVLLGMLPAAVAPFVAFTYTYVPLAVTLEDGPSGFALLAAPFLLGVPLVVWQVRRCFARPSAPWERKIVHALATVSALTSLLFICQLAGDPTLHGRLVALPVPIACGALLWWLLRNASAEEIPTAALALAYLTQVALPLLVFSSEPAVGWWLTLVAAIVVIAQLTLIVRHTRAARPATAPMSRPSSPESQPAELP